MPIYEYQCQSCGHQLEEMQKVTEPAITQCPKCQQDTLTKMISAPQIQFQGSGWYVNDYSAKKKSANQTESSTSSSTSQEKPVSSSKPQDSANDK